MATRRQEKVATLLKHIAARFLEEVSDRTSLITVTDAELSPDLKHGKIFVTIYPESKEEQALGFAKRQEHAFREVLKGELRGAILPRISFELDIGEKKRRRIDELVREAKSGEK